MERHGLSRPSANPASHSVGRLSPMAFLVGVARDPQRPQRDSIVDDILQRRELIEISAK